MSANGSTAVLDRLAIPPVYSARVRGFVQGDPEKLRALMVQVIGEAVSSGWSDDLASAVVEHGDAVTIVARAFEMQSFGQFANVVVDTIEKMKASEAADDGGE